MYLLVGSGTQSWRVSLPEKSQKTPPQSFKGRAKPKTTLSYTRAYTELGVLDEAARYPPSHFFLKGYKQQSTIRKKRNSI